MSAAPPSQILVQQPQSNSGIGIGSIILYLFLAGLLYVGYSFYSSATDPLGTSLKIFDNIGKKFNSTPFGKFLTGGGNKECQKKYGPNTFYDKIEGGTCFSCPTQPYHDMQVFENINSKKKCALRNCPSGYANDPFAGICYKCPNGYARNNLEPVWSKKACCKGFLCSGGMRPASKVFKWKHAMKKGKL